MRSASYRYSPAGADEQPRSRAVSLAITIAIHILALILLLRFVPAPPDRIPRPVSLQLMPETRDETDASHRERTVAHVRQASGGARPHTPAPPAPPVPHEAPPPKTPSPSVSLLPIDLASADISKVPAHPEDRASGGSGSGTSAGAGSGAEYGPGEGPDGARLYDPDWYTRPTDAELHTYIPASAPSSGWGLVACKTAPRFHVEDCRTLAESPAGSGYGRAVRDAAWQFRVLPPRVDGRPLIGVWVKIRIDYLEGAASVH